MVVFNCTHATPCIYIKLHPSLSLKPDAMTNVLCCSSLRRRCRRTDVLGLLVIVIDEVYFFRLGFWLQFLLYHLMNRWTRIGFFFFFFENPWVCFTICWVCFTICCFFFFRMGLLYHLLFRIDIGLFFPRWACSVTIFFFFLLLPNACPTLEIVGSLIQDHKEPKWCTFNSRIVECRKVMHENNVTGPSSKNDTFASRRRYKNTFILFIT